ncbi:hypothetical protein [Hanstruepera neustonica]|nr:hypothetical protein [Hanstruepera neustonica]
MKRLIISVLMLMAATLIFSQANETHEDDTSSQEIVKQEGDNSVLG